MEFVLFFFKLYIVLELCVSLHINRCEIYFNKSFFHFPSSHHIYLYRITPEIDDFDLPHILHVYVMFTTTASFSVCARCGWVFLYICWVIITHKQQFLSSYVNILMYLNSMYCTLSIAIYKTERWLNTIVYIWIENIAYILLIVIYYEILQCIIIDLFLIIECK